MAFFEDLEAVSAGLVGPPVWTTVRGCDYEA